MTPVELLERMVAIPSPSGGEGPLAEFLVGAMTELGFDAHVDDAGNAVGVRSGAAAGDTARELVMLGHLDTVPGAVPQRIVDGELWGRGAVDAKGPLAAFVVAGARAALVPDARLVVVGAVEEEAPTSKGARYRAPLHQPDACVIGEPSGWDAITVGYKGCLRLDYRATQPGGHGAGPRGAVGERACAFWQSLRALADEFNRGRDRLFEQLMPSLAKIATRSDGLTDAVDATFGFRLPPEFDTAALRARATALAQDAELRFYGEEPAWTAPRSTPLANAFLHAIRAHGGRARALHKTGTSDMNILGPAWNCPILAYGPGDSALDHAPDERLALTDYDGGIAVLGAALVAAGYAK